MALQDRLNEVADRVKARKPKFCKVGQFFEPGSKMPQEDQDVLFSAIETPLGTPNRISTVGLVYALRTEGYEISNASMDRHRSKKCSCFLTNKDLVAL